MIVGIVCFLAGGFVGVCLTAMVAASNREVWDKRERPGEEVSGTRHGNH